MIARIVVMGVSGCGKSTVGAALADRTGGTFVDGDDLHPPANIAKMTRGIPLDDADRAPWLAAVGAKLHMLPAPAFVACSALKRAYRDIIRDGVPGPVHFLHLAAPKSVLQARVAARKDHFMPPALLDSQYAILEPLGADELGAVVDIDNPIETVIAEAARYLDETQA